MTLRQFLTIAAVVCFGLAALGAFGAMALNVAGFACIGLALLAASHLS